MEGPPLGDDRREPGIPRRVRAAPGVAQQALGLDGPAAKHRQVAEGGIVERPRPEPGEVLGEHCGLDDVPGPDHGIEGAQRPLVAPFTDGGQLRGPQQRRRRCSPCTRRRLTFGEGGQLLGQSLIRRLGGRHPVPQHRSLVLGYPRGLEMQVDPPTRRQVLVDGGPHQGVRKADLPEPGLVACLQQPDGDGLIQRRQGILQPGNRTDGRQRRRGAHHGGRLHQASRLRTAGVESLRSLVEIGTRSRQLRLPRPPATGRHLVEQGPHVQRIACRVLVQPPGDAGGELRHSEGGGEGLDLRCRQRAQLERQPAGPRGEPPDSLRQAPLVLLPDGQHGETRSETSRRSANSRARRESMSDQCTSSTTRTTTPFSSSSSNSSNSVEPTLIGSSGGRAR